jgi:hypothetical protein
MTVITPLVTPGAGDDRPRDDKSRQRFAIGLRSRAGLADADARFEDADAMRKAAGLIEDPFDVVEDVEELDAYALDLNRSLERLTLLDRFGAVFTVYPNHHDEKVVVVRAPSLSEAWAISEGEDPDTWPQPLVFASSGLEQARFPARVIATSRTFIPLDLEPVSAEVVDPVDPDEDDAAQAA